MIFSSITEVASLSQPTTWRKDETDTAVLCFGPDDYVPIDSQTGDRCLVSRTCPTTCLSYLRFTFQIDRALSKEFHEPPERTAGVTELNAVDHRGKR
jgi:hypothetical protein